MAADDLFLSSSTTEHHTRTYMILVKAAQIRRIVRVQLVIVW
jgi:hypothetical protein